MLPRIQGFAIWSICFLKIEACRGRWPPLLQSSQRVTYVCRSALKLDTAQYEKCSSDNVGLHLKQYRQPKDKRKLPFQKSQKPGLLEIKLNAAVKDEKKCVE